MVENGERNWKENFKKLLIFIDIVDQKSRTDVNVILDQLNAEDYNPNHVSNQNDILAFFNKGCSLISAEKNNVFLLSKFFQLVEKILLKNKQVVLDDKTLNNLVEHVIKSANICPSISVYDYLKVLGVLLYENGGKCSKFYEDLLGVQPTGLLLKSCDHKNADTESQKAAIICIGNICVRDLNGSYINEHYAEIALLTVLNVLQNRPRKDVIKIDHCQLIDTSLKAIQDILPSVKCILKRHLGQILLTIKNYLFYGFPGYEIYFPNRASDSSCHSSSDLEPDDVGVLTLSLSPAKERTFPCRGALKKKKPRQKRGKRPDKNDEKFDVNVPSRTTNANRQQPVRNSGQVSQRGRKEDGEEMTNIAMDTNTVMSWREGGVPENDHVTWSSYYSSSESEFSDSESGQARRLSFISDGSGALTWSLFSIIQNDADFKNRTGAASVLMDLLDGSKQFLTAADDSDRHQASSARPFTSFSSRLGSIIYELHRLLDVIPTETSSLTQVQLLKSMAVLILNCPYHKLQPGLLTKVYKTIHPLLSKKDTTIKQSSLVCLGALLTINTPSNEVLSILENKTTSHDPTAQCGQPYAGAPDTPPLLVHECLEILRYSAPVPHVADSKDPVTLLRSEALHLLIVYARNYFNLLRPLLIQLTEIIHGCLKEPNSMIQVNCTKLLQELGRMMHETLYKEENEDQKAIVQQFWRRLLTGELVKILQSRDSSSNRSKAAACDCLSDIGANVYEELPFDKRILVITMLLGLTNDDDSYVKAASVRGLGVYVLYPLLREDVFFVTDAANAILNGLTDISLLVRMRAAWSLANLSDALVINKNTKQSTFKEDFSETLFLRLVNDSIKASEDNEKVKCNIVRSLGNFAKYLSQPNIDDKLACYISRVLEKKSYFEAYENIVGVLSKCIVAGQMKTRWNACYAAGNVLSNHALASNRILVTLQMFDALLTVVSTCKNFKVRINAVNALAVPSTRDCYGNEQQFIKVWCCLVDTLMATKTISDFSEFKYRDTLREQISETICHLSSLVTASDMGLLHVVISEHHKDLVQHLAVYYQNKLKLNDNCGEDSQPCQHREISDMQPTKLFLRAYDHVVRMKEDSFGPIQTLFCVSKKTADDYVQSIFEPKET